VQTISPALARLGWDDAYAAAFAAVVPPHAHPARVAVVAGQTLTVLTDTGPREATLAGRLRTATPDGGVTTGDWVVLDDGIVVDVVPRRSVLLRRSAGAVTVAQAVAANVDTVFIAVPLGRDVGVRRLERSLAIAWSSGAVPVTLLTKADLSTDLAGDIEAARVVANGVQVIAVSAGGIGIEALGAYLRPAHTGAIVGPSGAGKSTLINVLCGGERLATAAVRADGRGRHTTANRELVQLPSGALLIDTPGMREMGMWDAQSGIDEVFSDLGELAAGCRFSDCAHNGEPGCAVQVAADANPAVLSRLGALRKLEREQHFLDMQMDARLRADARRDHRRRARAIRAQPHR
jgi:ribosome small subunit-dependent GTPase A